MLGWEGFSMRTLPLTAQLPREEMQILSSGPRVRCKRTRATGRWRPMFVGMVSFTIAFPHESAARESVESLRLNTNVTPSYCPFRAILIHLDLTRSRDPTAIWEKTRPQHSTRFSSSTIATSTGCFGEKMLTGYIVWSTKFGRIN